MARQLIKSILLAGLLLMMPKLGAFREAAPVFDTNSPNVTIVYKDQ